VCSHPQNPTTEAASQESTVANISAIPIPDAKYSRKRKRGKRETVPGDITADDHEVPKNVQ
jgi:hypothetical protein